MNKIEDDFDTLSESTLSQEYKFKGKIINLRVDSARMPDGKIAQREVIEHPGGVCVLPLSNDGDVFLVRQYRYPYSEIISEIPAGKLSVGENPLECGKRELKEETGVTAKHYRNLGKLYPSPGYCGEIIHMYLATGLTLGEAAPDDDEFISVERIPLKEAFRRVMDGEIADAKTQAAILKTFMLVSAGEENKA